MLCGCQSITTARGIKLLTLGHLPPTAFIFTEALGKPQTPPFSLPTSTVSSLPQLHCCHPPAWPQSAFRRDPATWDPTHCEINSCCVTRQDWGCSLPEHAASTPLARHLKPVPGERARTPGCEPSGCGTWADTGGGRP